MIYRDRIKIFINNKELKLGALEKCAVFGSIMILRMIILVVFEGDFYLHDYKKSGFMTMIYI